MRAVSIFKEEVYIGSWEHITNCLATWKEKNLLVHDIESNLATSIGDDQWRLVIKYYEK